MSKTGVSATFRDAEACCIRRTLRRGSIEIGQNRMSDVFAPETSRQLDQREVVLRRDDPFRAPVSDVAVTAAHKSGEDFGAAESFHDVAGSELVHGGANVTARMSDDKGVVPSVNVDREHRLHGVHIRLRATRRVCEMGTVSEAARQFGIVRSRWSNWENDLGMPPPHLLVAMRRVYPWVCLNYIYAGDTNNVMPAVAKALQETEAELRDAEAEFREA